MLPHSLVSWGILCSTLKLWLWSAKLLLVWDRLVPDNVMLSIIFSVFWR